MTTIDRVIGYTSNMNSTPRNKRLLTTSDDSFPRSYLNTDVRQHPQVFRGRYSSSPSWNAHTANVVYNRNIIEAAHSHRNDRLSSSGNRKRRGSSYGGEKHGIPDVKYRRESLGQEALTPGNAKYRVHQLSEQMKAFAKSQDQSAEFLQKKLRLRSVLLAVFRKEFPAATLHLVGSSCNGFASKTSDADFCLMLSTHQKVDQRYEAVAYLRRLQKLLKGCAFIRKVLVIRAKVPILKFRDEVSGCDCDININNAVGIRNTHLLRTYSRVDDRVVPLVKVVKQWAKVQGINDASQGTLSSYSLVLMVIHYLQSGCKPPILASLQRDYSDYFSTDIEVDQLPQFDPSDYIPLNRSQNTKPVGELLCGFFEYFAVHYRWDVLAISIRLGKATPKALKYDWKDKFICIEEPFDSTNTARAVYAIDKFQFIKSQLTEAYNNIKVSDTIDCLFK